MIRTNENSNEYDALKRANIDMYGNSVEYVHDNGDVELLKPINLIVTTRRQQENITQGVSPLMHAREIAAMQDHPLWQQFINQPVSRGTKKSKQNNISK